MGRPTFKCGDCVYKQPFCKIMTIDDKTIRVDIEKGLKENGLLVVQQKDNIVQIRFNCIIQYYCWFKGYEIPDHQTTCLPYMGKPGEEQQRKRIDN